MIVLVGNYARIGASGRNRDSEIQLMTVKNVRAAIGWEVCQKYFDRSSARISAHGEAIK